MTSSERERERVTKIAAAQQAELCMAVVETVLTPRRLSEALTISHR